MPTQLSLIIPLLNERGGLAELIQQITLLQPAQAIIVDGGSNDGSWEWLQAHWQDQSNTYTLLRAGTGRAQQMNAGAKAAKQNLLLFLHADTQLPANASELIFNAASNTPLEKLWGRFDICFSTERKSMDVIAYFINLRSRVSSVATGDQAIFVSRALFDQVKGFDDIEILEDVAFSKKLRKLAQPHCLRAAAISSARRWEHSGVVTTVLKMWWYRLAFVMGVAPERLKRGYRNIR